jgi:hypothetical protein
MELFTFHQPGFHGGFEDLQVPRGLFGELDRLVVPSPLVPVPEHEVKADEVDDAAKRLARTDRELNGKWFHAKLLSGREESIYFYS